VTVDGRKPAGFSITVIVCTHNRGRLLPATLEQLAASELPSSVSWEVLVVDNNSTDQTREVVERFCREYPGVFRYVFEPITGKSYALNAGVRHARGTVLAFVDDDVALQPSWLQYLTGGLHDGIWAGAGGRILAAQEFTAPDWFSVEHHGGILFGLFDFGDEPRKLDHAPFGANMAFRKEMFDKYGLFRADLGPSPNPDIPRPNEDTEFGHRLIAAGERLRYEPKAVVRHPVLLERLNKTFCLAWWFDFGRASIVERGDRPHVYGIPWDFLSLLRRLMQISNMSLRWVFTIRASRRFFWKCMIWKQAGMIAELRRRLATRGRSQAAVLQ
jgi:glucosyl-dolichyl phosphate glucuronosyltransferase